MRALHHPRHFCRPRDLAPSRYATTIKSGLCECSSPAKSLRETANARYALSQTGHDTVTDTATARVVEAAGGTQTLVPVASHIYSLTASRMREK